MPAPELLTETLLEGTTGYYSFTLVDDTGEGVDGVFLTTMTVTLYDVDTNAVVNGRLCQNILNANGGTIATEVGPPLETVVTLELQPEDTVIFNEARLVEYRVLVFQWSWDLGQRHDAHAVQFGVENLLFVP